MRRLWFMFALLAAAALQINAQTAFTYQGELKSGGNPVNTQQQFIFKLFDISNNQIGPVLTSNITPTNGLFTTMLDFGSTAFSTGGRRFLEITVNGTILQPRQEITPAPYSIYSTYAGNVPFGGITGSPNFITSGTAAGGDLTGTYPNPTLATLFASLNKVSGGIMTALNSGNIGIGTSAPLKKLSVVGQIQSTTGGYVFPDGSVQTTASAMLGPGWALSGIHIYNTNTGNVGINVTNPQNRLQVNQLLHGAVNYGFVVSNTTYGANIQISGSNTFPAVGLNIDNDIQGDAFTTLFGIRSNVGGGSPVQYFTVNGIGGVAIGTPVTQNYKFYVNGTAGGSSGWNSLSDIRYKKDINTLTNALDTVNSLRGVNYNWRTDEFPDMSFSSGRQVGFIAQELQRFLPSLVNQDGNGMLSVNYAGLTPVLVEAIKAQQTEIKTLKSKNKMLESKLDSVLKRIDAIEKKSK